MQLTVADGLKYFDRLIVACNFMSRPISNFENLTSESKVKNFQVLIMERFKKMQQS